MGVIRRQSAFSSVAIYAGILFGFVLSLYIYPKYLAPDEIGLVKVLVDIAKLISPFLLLGVPSTFVKYYPYFKNSKETAGAFRLLSLLISGFGALLSLILFVAMKPYLESTFTNKAPLLAEFFEWIPILFFLIGGITLLRAFYRSDLNITLPNVYEGIVLRIFMIASILIYFYLDLEVQWLVYLYMMAHALALFGLGLGYYRSGNLRLSTNLKSIEPALRKEMFYFGLFVIANALSGSMIINIDSWMLASLSGLKSAGIYSIAMSIGIIIELPKRSITQIAVPVLANSWKNGNLANIRDVYHKTSLNQMITGGMIFILVWINVDDLFRLIPNGEVYSQGKWVVFYIGLAKLFSISLGANIEILQVSNFYRYSLLTRVLLVVTAVLTNLYFIPLYGITGAAIATAITFFSNNVILYLLLLIKLRIQPFKWVNLIAFFWLLIILSLGIYLPVSFEHPIWNMLARTAVVGAVFVGVLLRFQFSNDLREFLILGLKKLGIRL